MTPPPTPPPAPRTVLENLTQFAGQVRTQFGLRKPTLKPGAKVPSLEVYNPEDGSRQIHELVGERYSLGRRRSTTAFTFLS